MSKPDPPKCEKREHDFGPHEDVKEPNFGVTFGYKQTCHKCGWILYEDICETRASGGTLRLYPPEPKE